MSPSSPPELKHLHNEDMKRSVLSLREKVEPILAIDLLHHFTDHSVAHSDNVAAIVDNLIEPLQNRDNKLTDKELLILYYACYLHDIGMHYEKAGMTQTIKNLDDVGDWDCLQEDTRKDILRRHHHEISQDMVIMSVDAAFPVIGIQLNRADSPEYVAVLCKAHGLPMDSEEELAEYKKIIKDRAGVRISLLAGILRLADILDESQRRANPVKLRTLAIDQESCIHWWRHYYTEEMTFDTLKKIIHIWFDFSNENYKEYSKVIPQLQMPCIQTELGRQFQFLNPYDLTWSLLPETEPKQISTVEPIPADIFAAMSKRVDNQSGNAFIDEVSEELAFLNSCKVIEKKLKELRDSHDVMTPSDYLKALFVISKELWDAGGKRSAWNLLYVPFEQNMSTLDTYDQLDIGCMLASMLIDDENADFALRILDKLGASVDNLSHDDEKKYEYWQLRAKSLIAECNNDSVEALKIVIDLAPDENDKDLANAQLLEWYLLQGDFSDVIDILATMGGEEC